MSSRALPRWILALGALLLSVVPAGAQIGRQGAGLYIRGFVRFEPNQSAEGVKVVLKRQTGQILDSNYTRFNGQFEFHGLGSERYVLEIEHEGYLPVREVVEIIGPPGLAGVTLVLRRSNIAENPVGVPAALSARELAIPEAARERYQQGEAQLREKQDAAGAVLHLVAAVKLYPEYYEAHQLLGVAYMQLQKEKDAKKAFQDSIHASKEKYGPAYAGLASLSCDTEQFAEAEPLARRAVELDGGVWQGHFELARALLGLNRAEEAKASAKRALELNAGLNRGYLLLAKIHQALQNYPAMLADIDEFLRREPKGSTSDQIRKTRGQLAKALSEAGMDVPAEPPRD